MYLLHSQKQTAFIQCKAGGEGWCLNVMWARRRKLALCLKHEVKQNCKINSFQRLLSLMLLPGMYSLCTCTKWIIIIFRCGKYSLFSVTTPYRASFLQFEPSANFPDNYNDPPDAPGHIRASRQSQFMCFSSNSALTCCQLRCRLHDGTNWDFSSLFRSVGFWPPDRLATPDGIPNPW